MASVASSLCSVSLHWMYKPKRFSCSLWMSESSKPSRCSRIPQLAHDRLQKHQPQSWQKSYAIRERDFACHFRFLENCSFNNLFLANEACHMSTALRSFSIALNWVSSIDSPTSLAAGGRAVLWQRSYEKQQRPETNRLYVCSMSERRLCISESLFDITWQIVEQKFGEEKVTNKNDIYVK